MQAAATALARFRIESGRPRVFRGISVYGFSIIPYPTLKTLKTLNPNTQTLKCRPAACGRTRNEALGMQVVATTPQNVAIPMQLLLVPSEGNELSAMVFNDLAEVRGGAGLGFRHARRV